MISTVLKLLVLQSSSTPNIVELFNIIDNGNCNFIMIVEPLSSNKH